MLYTRLISEALRQPWALTPDMMAVVADVLRYRASGGRLTAEEIRARIGDDDRPKPEARTVRDTPGQANGGAIGVLPVYGVIAHRTFEASSGMTSAEAIGRQLQAFVRDPEIGTILLDIASPGGTVAGIPELGDQIWQARKSKRVVAISNALAASAAYWLMSQAHEAIVTPSGAVGSIGVYALHEDYSKWLEKEGIAITAIQAGANKLEGAPWEPLSDEAKEHFQAGVDDAYRQFTAAVARGRGVSASVVRGERFGQGRVFEASDAKERGLVDSVETFDALVTRLLRESATANRGARRAADDAAPEIQLEGESSEVQADHTDTLRLAMELEAEAMAMAMQMAVGDGPSEAR